MLSKERIPAILTPVPDTRRHRGAHPKDAEYFCEATRPRLVAACSHLAWLLSRGYAQESALKLVGDRHALTQRQRMAVTRMSCSDDAARTRRSKARRYDDLRGCALAVDTFNCLIGIETALSGGLLLRGFDSATRDLATVHGTYRKVEETEPALRLLLKALSGATPASVTFYVDSPVSNSGRVAQLARTLVAESNHDWEINLVHDADRCVVDARFDVAVSCDGGVIDRATAWFDATGYVADQYIGSPWLIAIDE